MPKTTHVLGLTKKHVNLSSCRWRCHAGEGLSGWNGNLPSSHFRHVIAHGLELHGGAHQI